MLVHQVTQGVEVLYPTEGIQGEVTEEVKEMVEDASLLSVTQTAVTVISGGPSARKTTGVIKVARSLGFYTVKVKCPRTTEVICFNYCCFQSCYVGYKGVNETGFDFPSRLV